MVKVYGPMMSLDASGSLADTITFSKWKGRNYVRERVVPSNPKTGAQMGRRAMFAFLTQNWADLLTAEKATWQDLADEIVASTFNAYLKTNMERWHNFLSPGQDLPIDGAGTGSDRALTTATWEENRIKLDSTATTLNENWGFIIYATDGVAFTPAVGNAIIVSPDPGILAKVNYWTPPSVTTWYFNSMCFSEDGTLVAAGGEQNAVPP